jgi:hypothetical protein
LLWSFAKMSPKPARIADAQPVITSGVILLPLIAKIKDVTAPIMAEVPRLVVFQLAKMFDSVIVLDITLFLKIFANFLIMCVI